MRAGKTGSNNWATPQYIYNYYNKIYKFELDAAADAENKKAPLYYDEEMNGLTQPWAPLATWVNPPYYQIGKWVDKAIEESQKGCYVVMLLPAGTDTKWFAKCMEKAGVIHFITGRLKFGEGKGSAMSPSIVVIFNGFYKNTNPAGPVITCVEIKNEQG